MRYLDKISLDRRLVESLPPNLVKLDKNELVISVYEHLCRTLRYDEVSFLSLGNGAMLREEVSRHKSIGNIEKISPTNNAVICSDFSIILAKIVSNYIPESRFYVREDDTGLPGRNHESLIIELDEYIDIQLDPLRNFTNSDFLRARLDLPLLFDSHGTSKDTTDFYREYARDLRLSGADTELRRAMDGLQRYLDILKLPPVESLSFVKGVLRSVCDSRITTSHYGTSNNVIVSVYSVHDQTNTGGMVLCSGILEYMEGVEYTDFINNLDIDYGN